ncbi:MAG: acylneuraminate cytidylyltransferase family protein [Muribaculaceae bacterium]|nr:acylneuraminate cytidylyltransferase family protein [Muribaculaceae bacterium]
MAILALIPARCNSKGIPGKNIRPFRGLPLLAHSIRHAQAAGFRNEDIVLTTDSEQYAEIGRQYGADVPFLRPDELATDTAGSREVMLHAVDTLASAGRVYDTICLLQPTSPLRDPQDIRDAIALYESTAPDMVAGVSVSGANPYYNLFEPDAEGCLHISKGDGLITRRQDAPPVYEFNGAIYIIRVEALRHSPITRFDRIMPLVMPAERSLDLDTEADWQRLDTGH